MIEIREKVQLPGGINPGPLDPAFDVLPLELSPRPSCAKVGTLETPLCYAAALLMTNMMITWVALSVHIFVYGCLALKTVEI